MRYILFVALIALVFFNPSIIGSAYARSDMHHGMHKQCPMEMKDCCCNKQGKQCPLDKSSCCDKKGMKSKGHNADIVRSYEKAFARMHQGMDIEYTGDVDTDFVRGMIPHHQGAVDMAKVELKYGQDEHLRELAEWIVSIQNQEIAQMKQWLRRKGAPLGEKAPGYDAGAVETYQAAMHQMHRDMNIDYTGNADVDFVRGMIPHHQGAVDMAKVVLAHGRDAEINQLADDVIRTQNGEIAMMQRWLEKHGIKAPKANSAEHLHH